MSLPPTLQPQLMAFLCLSKDQCVLELYAVVLILQLLEESNKLFQCTTVNLGDILYSDELVQKEYTQILRCVEKLQELCNAAVKTIYRRRILPREPTRQRQVIKYEICETINMALFWNITVGNIYRQ